LLSVTFKILSQYFSCEFDIAIMFEFALSKFSHSKDIVAGVTTLTTSLFTIHLSFGSETCSAIATLYQASIKTGKYLSLA
jgi:hypothetical protein